MKADKDIVDTEKGIVECDRGIVENEQRVVDTDSNVAHTGSDIVVSLINFVETGRDRVQTEPGVLELRP